jgi:hypothetical protein
VSALAASAQDASSQIKSEIERLQQSLKEKPVSSPALRHFLLRLLISENLRQERPFFPSF